MQLPELAANFWELIGGASLSVGASGGWVMGGGHGALTNNYGLGVDNVLEMKVVLANGTLITANRRQNTDMFFALRGGGGGTFGVVLKTTSQIYKIAPM
jgi:FAD/FMN-containing dehydrogenase